MVGFVATRPMPASALGRPPKSAIPSRPWSERIASGKANEILRLASACFAQAEFDRRTKS